MAITSAIEDLFKSIYELVASVLGTFYAVVHSLIAAILGFVRGFFTLVGDVVNGMVEVLGGVGKFIAGNLVLIAIGGAAVFLYVRYTAQGQRVASAKKTQ